MADSVHMLNLEFYKQQGEGTTKFDVSCYFDNCELTDLPNIAATTVGAMAKALFENLPEAELQDTTRIIELLAAFWLDTVGKSYIEITKALLQGKTPEEQEAMMLAFVQTIQRMDHTGMVQAYPIKVRKGSTRSKAE